MIIYNNILPFNGFKLCNICGLIFVRKGTDVTREDIMHEAIHTEQIAELLIVGFYVIYLLEWVVKGIFVYPTWRKAYRNISFEREAYENENNPSYLDERKLFGMWR